MYARKPEALGVNKQDQTGITGSSPPLDPPDSMLWWDNISGQLCIFYNDGNSKQWVIASPSPDPAQFLTKLATP